jgi:hypothetical protein
MVGRAGFEPAATSLKARNAGGLVAIPPAYIEGTQLGSAFQF